jgi:hypothetical protein
VLCQRPQRFLESLIGFIRAEFARRLAEGGHLLPIIYLRWAVLLRHPRRSHQNLWRSSCR